jgi:hypothetical protein
MEETQMESKKRDVLLTVILTALLFTAFYCLTGKAGSLEPYAAPQPTMVTLDQISAQIAELSSPVKKVVRGVITFAKGQGVESTQTFSPAVDPARSVVLLSDAVVLDPDSTTDDNWIFRSGACLINLTDTQITVRVEAHAANQKVSYQIVEYK